MGGIYCAASFLSITASDISDQLASGRHFFFAIGVMMLAATRLIALQKTRA